MSEQRQSEARVALLALFIAFLRVSLLGFGGGLEFSVLLDGHQGSLSQDSLFYGEDGVDGGRFFNLAGIDG